MVIYKNESSINKKDLFDTTRIFSGKEFIVLNPMALSREMEWLGRWGEKVTKIVIEKVIGFAVIKWSRLDMETKQEPNIEQA